MQTRNAAQRPPGFELFFSPLQIYLDPKELESVQFAYIVSKYGHRGQTRDDGSRYFDHPKAAAWIYISELNGNDPRLIIDLLLHDISEDAYLLTPYRIRLNLGVDIALDLQALTKLPKGKESTADYLMRICLQGPWAITAKLCDRLHNLRNLATCTIEKQRAQFAETHEYHLAILIPALRQYGGQWISYADALEAKMSEALAETHTRISE